MHKVLSILIEQATLFPSTDLSSDLTHYKRNDVQRSGGTYWSDIRFFPDGFHNNLCNQRDWVNANLVQLVTPPNCKNDM